MDQEDESRLTPYKRWLKKEKIPVIRDYSVKDLNQLGRNGIASKMDRFSLE